MNKDRIQDILERVNKLLRNEHSFVVGRQEQAGVPITIYGEDYLFRMAFEEVQPYSRHPQSLPRHMQNVRKVEIALGLVTWQSWEDHIFRVSAFSLIDAATGFRGAADLIPGTNPLGDRPVKGTLAALLEFLAEEGEAVFLRISIIEASEEV